LINIHSASSKTISTTILHFLVAISSGMSKSKFTQYSLQCARLGYLCQWWYIIECSTGSNRAAYAFAICEKGNVHYS